MLKNELGLVFIKPEDNTAEMVDYVRRRLSVLEKSTIILEREMFMTYEQACFHYDKNDAWCLKFGTRRHQFIVENKGGTDKTPLELGQEILEGTRRYVTGKIYVFVLIGEDINARLRIIAGSTNPKDAAPGTIRSKSNDSFEKADEEMRPTRTIVHVSENETDAFREIPNLLPNLAFLCVNRCLSCDGFKYAQTDNCS